MSYDIHLEADLGGPEPIQVGDLYWNCTSNLAPMWRAAGADLASFDGRPAWECIPVLATAIGELELHPETYTPMNPANGWGSYEALLPILRNLLAAFKQAPQATVRVSR